MSVDVDSNSVDVDRQGEQRGRAVIARCRHGRHRHDRRARSAPCTVLPQRWAAAPSARYQFVDPALGGVARQSLVLGLVQILVALTVNGLIVLSAGALAVHLTTRPRWQRAQRVISGTVLAALAVRIAADRSRAAVA